MAARDEAADTSRTTRPKEREGWLSPAPEQLVHAIKVPTGSEETRPKDRPAG